MIKNTEVKSNNTVDMGIVWYKFPDVSPEELDPGQYERYLVSLKTGHVFECSWLFGGWHTRHDGCSDRTKEVQWWCKKPAAPAGEQ